MKIRQLVPITMAFAVFFIMPLAAQAETCATDEPFPYKTAYDIEQCPEDIQALLNRINSCAYLEGEAAYDEDRAAFLAEMMAERRCADLGCDFQDVFMNHEGDLAYTGVLFEYAKMVYGDYDNIPSCEQE